MLGSNLAYFFRDKYDITGWYNLHKVFIPGVDSFKVDITDKQSVKDFLADYKPNIILHCASLTNIDYCETNKDETRRVNIEGTQNIASACRDQDVKLVYISTESVYEGKKGNHIEDDLIAPRNYYGQTKYEAEASIKNHKNYIIVRTNIFGWNVQNKHSLAEWILDNLQKGRSVEGFNDAVFTSIYTLEFSRILDKMLEKDLTGIFNLACRRPLSKYDFAVLIAKAFGKDISLIKPITIDAYPFFAKRGKNLSLNTEKLSKALGQEMPSIEECVDFFLKDYQSGLCDEIKRCYYPPICYPSLDIIGYGRQNIDSYDIEAVVEVLKSSNLTQGKKIEEFEKALCKYTGAKYAVAVSSGTAALHIACLAAGLNDKDEFITSPNTFVASVNCGVYCKAKPVFADIKKDTYNIDPEKIREKINANTRVVIPVHFAGQICDMEEIKNIVSEKEIQYKEKIFIIEDASHALGSLYKGSAAGACTYSDMTVMSFHPVKHITTGEGGAVFTNDERIYKKLKLLRSHGITNNENDLMLKDQAYGSTGLNLWYYEQQYLGFNYRITDIQCALGISQLNKIDYFLRRRRRVVEFYNRALADIDGIVLPFESKYCLTNWHLYVLQVDFDAFKKNRADIVRKLKVKGVGVHVHYIPVHLQPYYQNTYGFRKGDYPIAEKYYAQALSVPLYPALSKDDIEKVVTSLREVLKKDS